MQVLPQNIGLLNIARQAEGQRCRVFNIAATRHLQRVSRSSNRLSRISEESFIHGERRLVPCSALRLSHADREFPGFARKLAGQVDLSSICGRKRFGLGHPVFGPGFA